jgi:hypothetical protein
MRSSGLSYHFNTRAYLGAGREFPDWGKRGTKTVVDATYKSLQFAI